MAEHDPLDAQLRAIAEDAETWTPVPVSAAGIRRLEAERRHRRAAASVVGAVAVLVLGAGAVWSAVTDPTDQQPVPAGTPSMSSVPPTPSSTPSPTRPSSPAGGATRVVPPPGPPATPSSTPDPTATPSPTPTPTPSATPSPTANPSGSPTASASGSPSTQPSPTVIPSSAPAPTSTGPGTGTGTGPGTGPQATSAPEPSTSG